MYVETNMIHRQLYRSILRSCERGRRVECLPFEVFFSDREESRDRHQHPKENGVKDLDVSSSTKTNILPQSPKHAMERLRTLARTPLGTAEDSRLDPFSVMRRAEVRRYALAKEIVSNPPKTSTNEYPAFVLPSHTLLPGENATFHMFETRYVNLCRRIEHDERRFVHLAARKESIRTDVDPIGTVVTCTDMRTLQDGRVVLACLAGPRVRVLQQRDEEMYDGSAPLLHVSCEMYDDHDKTEDENTASACRSVLNEIFEESSELRTLMLATPGGGMPPLFNGEGLSLWMCGSFFDPANVRERLANLYTQDTGERLKVALEEATRFLERTRAGVERESEGRGK